jgi:hypothetical protein
MRDGTTKRAHPQLEEDAHDFERRPAMWVFARYLIFDFGGHTSRLICRFRHPSQLRRCGPRVHFVKQVIHM